MRNWRTLIVMFSLLSLLAAACGGDAEDTADEAASDVGGAADTAESEVDEETSEAASEPASEMASEMATEDMASEMATEDMASESSESSEAAGGGEELSATLNGAGASFPDPVYQAWIGEYTQEVQPGVTINYNAVGSGSGREQFIAQEVIFAGSDAFMDDEEIAAAEEARGEGEVLHIPTVFGGVAVTYNIPGLEGLILDAATISSIFRGEIANINDPAIAELNPDIELPDQPLTVVHRADGSGTTSIFTTWLEDEDETWATELGSGDEVEWPTGIGGEQNDGVASAISQQPGGIGYLSLEFAVEAGLPFAQVVNADGNPIEPSTETVGQAVDGLELPEDLRFDVLGVGGEGYPIAGATWILAYTAGYEETEAEALRDYLTWTLEEGDETASELGYAPLSDGTQELSIEKIEQINADG